jgi:hypothetical protein
MFDVVVHETAQMRKTFTVSKPTKTLEGKSVRGASLDYALEGLIAHTANSNGEV